MCVLSLADNEQHGLARLMIKLGNDAVRHLAELGGPDPTPRARISVKWLEPDPIKPRSVFASA